jgi:hypothetical protein
MSDINILLDLMDLLSNEFTADEIKKLDKICMEEVLYLEKKREQDFLELYNSTYGIK